MMDVGRGGSEDLRGQLARDGAVILDYNNELGEP